MPLPFDLVCIIDDDPIYVNLVTRIVKLKNFSRSLLVFQNGQEALEYFKTLNITDSDTKIPQLILLDINMPIMDGWEFLEEFSKFSSTFMNKLQLYVVSSSINPADIRKAKSVDFVTDYITKPLHVDSINSIFDTPAETL